MCEVCDLVTSDSSQMVGAVLSLRQIRLPAAEVGALLDDLCLRRTENSATVRLVSTVVDSSNPSRIVYMFTVLERNY